MSLNCLLVNSILYFVASHFIRDKKLFFKSEVQSLKNNYPFCKIISCPGTPTVYEVAFVNICPVYWPVSSHLLLDNSATDCLFQKSSYLCH